MTVAAALLFIPTRMVSGKTRCQCFARQIVGGQKWAVNAVVGGNLAWVAASLALPLSGLVSPNAVGWTFLLLQAAAVAILAALEYGAASRSTLAAA